MSKSARTAKVAKTDSSIRVEAAATLSASQDLAGLEKDDEFSTLKIEFESYGRLVTITYTNAQACNEESTLRMPAEHAFKIPAVLRALAGREEIFSSIDAIEEFVGTEA